MTKLVKQQKWYKSKPFWGAVLSILVIISKDVFEYEPPSELVENIMTIILWTIVGIGVRNNPSLKEEL